ncbi:hypothetical protein [Stenotrophomonas oahuensis]|uniref:Addiction module antitoxin n=1 Tax=Stenotrophomonas oahuensis TaxID=3003271 RepID=A0ABY9YUU3_9GAMM|nr:hypothetical protein [Stenotrophomonas sp. A5586]WNH54789.1 hypothetical protein PDM29_05740 [Stenotrophomonas sp. A5586]
MKKPAWVRTRVEDELRSDFKGVLKRTPYAPAEAIRLFMRRIVEIGHDTTAVERAQWRRAILNASDHVADSLCIGEKSPTCREENEVQRVRRPVGASPGSERD